MGRYMKSSDAAKARIYLNVPYSEKECAKSFGARWDADRRSWCVPDGVMLARFERWLPSSAAGNRLMDRKPAEQTRGAKKPAKKKAPRVDSYIGKTITGAHYFAHDHDCSPFEDCEVCRPVLEASGWAEARRAALVAAAHRQM